MMRVFPVDTMVHEAIKQSVRTGWPASVVITSGTPWRDCLPADDQWRTVSWGTDIECAEVSLYTVRGATAAGGAYALLIVETWPENNTLVCE